VQLVSTKKGPIAWIGNRAAAAGIARLDISSFIAAPAAAVVLGDWGADVIKVEGPDGDPNRSIMHDSSNYPKAEVNYPWQMDSRNKRSIVLDLKKPERAPRSTG
jgi:formyl-CoA transferase